MIYLREITKENFKLIKFPFLLKNVLVYIVDKVNFYSYTTDLFKISQPNLLST